MALDADDEILQDFLIEATEILEKLNEQLVDLEQRPDDRELLNAVFRGFHTIKGGAGFLNLTALVDVCHRAEDVFNLLRSGQKRITSQLMDTMLPVLDVLNAQFEHLRAGEEPEPAEAALLQQLEALNHPDGEEEVAPAAPTAPPPDAASTTPVAAVAPAASAAESMVTGDITDEEFEALLNALETPAAGQPVAAAAVTAGAGHEAPPGDNDEISEEEFEALLDELHGKGKFTGVPAAAPQSVAPAEAATPSDDITEEEFEALLDQLHGKGKFSGVPQTAPPAASAPQPAAAAPAPAPQRTAAAKPGGEGEKKAADTAQQETSVRVDTKRLDDIMNLVGELVLVRNRLATLAQGAGASGREEVAKTVGNLDVVTGDLQAAVMKTRMQPIKKVFGRFPRVVRDLARNMQKQVNLVLEGEETDLDKNLVEALADPLVHLVRNAVDHGIEVPEKREAAGKPRTGTLRLAAQQEGDHILLLIEDDGAGMDAEVLRRKAVEKGMMDADAAARLDEKECYHLIFAAGFSTKAQISDVSGRGVGMDVVKTRIAQLNGIVDVDSALGKGTRIIIKVPLTLAIMPTLMVKLRGQTFALPLPSVSEIFHLDLTKTNIVDGRRVVVVRDKALPLFYLTRWLVKSAYSAPLPDEGHVVMVHIGNQQVGFVVDELIGQEEVVIKPLGALLQGTPGLAGATITGDGRIALIVDVPSLLKAYGQRRQ
ncbi:MAG: chemotaxis protein CheA [Gammaproteobacteria bacterium]|nr:chemotaxis protein CheA [Gammaproteobacteria bacterium]